MDYREYWRETSPLHFLLCTSGKTQSELAQRMGTTQSSISRALRINPSIDFLRRAAKSLGYRLHVVFEPIKSDGYFHSSAVNNFFTISVLCNTDL